MADDKTIPEVDAEAAETAKRRTYNTIGGIVIGLVIVYFLIIHKIITYEQSLGIAAAALIIVLIRERDRLKSLWGKGKQISYAFPNIKKEKEFFEEFFLDTLGLRLVFEELKQEPEFGVDIPDKFYYIFRYYPLVYENGTVRTYSFLEPYKRFVVVQNPRFLNFESHGIENFGVVMLFENPLRSKFGARKEPVAVERVPMLRPQPVEIRIQQPEEKEAEEEEEKTE